VTVPGAALQNAGRHDLVGAATADAKQELDRPPIYIRKGVSLCRIAATFAQFLRRIRRIAATRRAAGRSAVGIGSERFDEGPDVGDLDRAGVQQFLSAIEQGQHGRGRDVAGVEVGRIVDVARGKGQFDSGDHLFGTRRMVGKQSDGGQTPVLRTRRASFRQCARVHFAACGRLAFMVLRRPAKASI